MRFPQNILFKRHILCQSLAHEEIYLNFIVKKKKKVIHFRSAPVMRKDSVQQRATVSGTRMGHSQGPLCPWTLLLARRDPKGPGRMAEQTLALCETPEEIHLKYILGFFSTNHDKINTENANKKKPRIWLIPLR